MALSGQPFYSNLHNADGTVGIEHEAEVATVNLSIEHKALLSTVAAQTGQFQFTSGRLLVDAALDASSITIGSVQIRDAVAGTLANVKTDGVNNAMVVTQNSQPLPTGAATEATLSTASTTLSSILSSVATAANQSTANASLASIDTKVTGLATQATLVLVQSDLDSILSGMATATNQGTEITHLASLDSTLSLLNAKFSSLGQKAMAASVPVVLPSDQTVAVSVSSIPLPTGASTSANQTTEIASLQSIDTKTPALGSATSALSSPVVIASDQVVPVSASSLPLPSGASTSANQTTGNTSLASIDGKTPSLGQNLMAASSPVVIASDQSTLPISAASLPLPTGAATAANQTTGNSSLSSIDGKLTTTVNGLKVDGSAVTQPISAASLPLPSGASTSANQSTANASLASIDGKLNSLGQKTMAASAPVVIASDQSPIPVTISGDTITISENIAQWGGVNTSLGQKVMASSVPMVLASDQSAIPVSQSGTWTVGLSAGSAVIGHVIVDSSALPTGASTSAKQPAFGTAGTPSADVITVQGSAGMTPLNVDGSAVTQPISATALPLPTGAATSANQTTANASLASIDTKLTGPFDISDRAAREIGKVSGSDVIYVTESYTTTNTNANARPTNGNFLTRTYKTKEIIIQNTGATNSARITVSGSVDGGSTFPLVISNNTLLAALNTLEVAETRAFTHIQVLARANNAGNQTTISTSGYAQGT